MDRLDAETHRFEAALSRRHRQYSWTSMGHVFGHQERERNALALLKRYNCVQLAEKTILDVGCGSGSWIQQFIRWGARPEHVTGIDLIPEKVAKARESLPASVRLEVGNAAVLPFAPGSFDVVLQATVFTSVLDSEVRRQIASEMLRVVKSDGLIIWYDFSVNNPMNPDVRGVEKREIMSLFSGCQLDLRRVTLVPPLVRWLAPYSWFLTYAASQIPPFCTHYLGAITKQATARAT